MRILVVTGPGAGHLFPLVPVVGALRSAGHEVLLATAGPGTRLGPAAGLATVDAAPGTDLDAVFAREVRDSGGFAKADRDQARALAVRLFGAASNAMLDGVRRCAQAWRPHAILHESLCGAGAVVAAECGIPAVVQSIGWAAPASAMISAMWSLLASGTPVSPVAEVGIAPASLAPAPHWSIRVRPVPYTGGALIPDGVLASPQRPRVLVTMGTVASQFGGFAPLRALIDALASEPVELLAGLRPMPEGMGCWSGWS